ncbi:hypothetical protein SDJN02_03504, partial [Cucurbita argyrosperma subsp. argyrosperma]
VSSTLLHFTLTEKIRPPLPHHGHSIKYRAEPEAERDQPPNFLSGAYDERPSLCFAGKILPGSVECRSTKTRDGN